MNELFLILLDVILVSDETKLLELIKFFRKLGVVILLLKVVTTTKSQAFASFQYHVQQTLGCTKTQLLICKNFKNCSWLLFEAAVENFKHVFAMYRLPGCVGTRTNG